MEDVLYIVMPAYNEAANIEAVVRSWYVHVADKAEGSRLVVADAGSTDDTHGILLKLCDELPRLELLTKSDKQHGPKCIALYRYAIDAGADYVFQTDSDGQTDPEEFSLFWKHRKEYDAILGNRTKREDGYSRFLVERTVVCLLWLIFGVRVPDANAPFRLMSCKSLNKYLDRLPEDYFIPNIMLTVYYRYYKERLAFKSIHFHARSGGENNINIPRIVGIGLQSIADFHRFKKEM